ncbi:unnamed protein product [Leptidea sinapis]|uniref:Uncharacterized protein n=1 Tax=Leptidea sinapis TaxID=189913 RepID=A0A5E4QLL2_9NEOP|nr:unnamed protein product [Leptidea sinapis]
MCQKRKHYKHSTTFDRVPVMTDYSAAPSQESRNIRTRVIQEEFHIRQQTYEKSQKKEEELHKLRIAVKDWMVKAAKKIILKAKTEREAAEELLHCNRAKREEAELSCKMEDRRIVDYLNRLSDSDDDLTN